MLSDVRVFVRPLPFDLQRSEVDDVFGKFGPLQDIKILRGYGFVEFKNSDDAKNAVDELNSSDFHGQSLTVEFAKEMPPSGPRDRDRGSFYDDRGGRGGGRGGRGGRDGYRDRYGPPPSSAGRYPAGRSYRVIVSNLPEDTVWQDLKDFARSADVEVHYANCRNRDGTGIIDFNSREDMNRAIDTLAGKEFKGNPVSLNEDPRPPPPPPPPRYRDDFRRGGRRGGGGFGRRNDPRDRSPSRGRRSYGRDRDSDYRRGGNSRSRSRSRSYSPRRGDSRSPPPPPPMQGEPRGRSRSPPSPPRDRSRSPPAKSPEDSGTW